MTEAVDMSQFIEAKSDQLNSDDLIGRTLTIKVTKVTGSDSDQPVAIHFEGDNGKPFKPCKTIRRVLVAVWGRYANDYVGRSMTLYRDDSVTFGGMQVGGIRISHMSHLEKETVVVVAKSKGKKAGMKILPLQVEQQVDKAAEWAAEQIASIAACADSAALDAVIAKGAKAMGKLEKDRPPLHAQVTAAIAEKRSQLAGNDPGSTMLDDDDDPFGSSDETQPWTAYVASTAKRIDEATTPAELDEIAGTLGESSGLPEEELTKLDTAIAKKRRALGKGV